MLPEDIRRLEREASIGKAVRGPDYSQLEKSISRAKAAFREGQKAAGEEQARQNRAVNRREVAFALGIPEHFFEISQ